MSLRSNCGFGIFFDLFDFFDLSFLGFIRTWKDWDTESGTEPPAPGTMTSQKNPKGAAVKVGQPFAVASHLGFRGHFIHHPSLR